jgi:hypothetical protein
MREAPDTFIIFYPVEWNGFFGIGWGMRLEVLSVASAPADVNGKP